MHGTNIKISKFLNMFWNWFCWKKSVENEFCAYINYFVYNVCININDLEQITIQPTLTLHGKYTTESIV